MITGKMRFVPVRNAPGFYDIYFCTVSSERPGFKAFSCEYNHYRLISPGDYNSLQIMCNAYERLSGRTLTIFELSPRASFAGAMPETFEKLPTLEYFLGYH